MSGARRDGKKRGIRDCQLPEVDSVPYAIVDLEDFYFKFGPCSRCAPEVVPLASMCQRPLTMEALPFMLFKQ